MSPNGQSLVISAPAGPTAMVFGAGAIPAGLWFDEHAHPQHQIAWATRGVITVEVGEGHWVLPPTRALWIPGNVPHRTGTLDGATLSGIFLDPQRSPVAFAVPTMLRVTPLLHELFVHLIAEDTAPGQRRHAEAVVFDLLDPVEVVPIGARMPELAPARPVADLLTANPADTRTLAELATTVAVSPRTLARAFQAETGITFGQWRTQVRLAASLPLLATGLPLAGIATRIGYTTPSAYVAAFRREVGVSPGRYFTR
ncbi:AraC family transcriptional regulator [Nocardia jejuensis]|uniref:AraC family transcriptional regulator n=1 Tax=Nocardia jejuensis TaxID=328049 RepID=UPI000A5AE2E8|nr:helix-turn-helix transcriptional regulator [Nocardia jejuensis]